MRNRVQHSMVDVGPYGLWIRWTHRYILVGKIMQPAVPSVPPPGQPKGYLPRSRPGDLQGFVPALFFFGKAERSVW